MIDKNERFEQLDSLRGLAALSVLFGHYLIMLPAISDSPEKLWFLKYTPIHLFWAGHEAVIFFFVLSGFVLSLQFYKRKVDYRSFFIKRVCRIYIPYIVWVIVAILASIVFYSGPKADLSAWFNRAWSEEPSFNLVLQHFLLVPSFRNAVFDPVLWSLVHEMRLSILFPLIMIPILKFNWKVNIGLAVLATFLSMMLFYISHHILRYNNDYPFTLHYCVMFIFGALLAKHWKNLVEWHQSCSKAIRYGLVVLAILFYLFPWMIKWITSFRFHFIEEWIVSMGVAIFIISALGSWNLSRLLALRPIYFLGRVSYSLYLIHAICLLSLTHLLYGRTELWVIWILGIGCTLLLSWLSYRYIEIPSINIGKRLSSGYKNF